MGGAIATTFGDVDDDGVSELIVSHEAADSRRPSLRVNVYRTRPDRSPTLVDLLTVSVGSSTASAGTLAVGNVDPFVAGDEIVIAGDGSRRRGASIRVFGGMADGRPQLLTSFPGESEPRRTRLSADSPIAVVLGEVVRDADHPSYNIVVGDAHGSVSVWRVWNGRPELIGRFASFPDSPTSSAHHLGAGRLIPQMKGDQIVVADDGTRKDGLVRVFDGATGTPIVEFAAFGPDRAPFGVEVWVADVIGSLPGKELIVGQGRAGGTIEVFSVTEQQVRHVIDIPDLYHRKTSLPQQLAIGALIPDLPGNQVAVAQGDPTFPVQVFSLTEDGASTIGEIDALSGEAGAASAVGRLDAIAVGH